MLQFYFENDWFSLKETTLQRAFHIHDGRAPTTSYVAACSCFCVYTDFSEIATFFVDGGSFSAVRVCVPLIIIRRARPGTGSRVYVWVCVYAPTWPGTSFWGYPSLDLRFESV